jgi:hypothetical protein
MAQSAWREDKSAQSAERMAHSVKPMVKFRFQDLDIWQLAIEIANRLFDIADELESKHLYRFAEQLRGAGMSMPNNIAEGQDQPRTGNSFSSLILPGGPLLRMPISLYY